MVCGGWGWDNVREAFKQIESHDDDTLAAAATTGNATGGLEHDGEYGTSGSVNVAGSRFHSELCDRFLEASREIGLPIHDGASINSNPQEGAGYFLQSARDGFRCSSAVAHLNGTFERSNLHVVTDCLVGRVVLDERDRRRAVGVTLLDQAANHNNNKDQSRPPTLHVRVDASDPRSEVILSAGAIGSPHILQLSGIGDGATSERIGVDHHVHLPGVGQNLQDHLQLRQVFECRGLPTLNTQLATYLQQFLVGVQYAANRTGPLSMAASQVCAFVKTQEGMARPDVQFHLQPLSAGTPGAGLDPYSAFTSSVCQLRPTSTGSIEVMSADPTDAPRLHPNYLSTEEDVRCAVDALRFSRRLCAETKAMAPITGKELRPGSQFVTDDELLEGAMLVAESIYHPAGTCRMGAALDGGDYAADVNAVVDPELRVLGGVKNLRVVDCSIMPSIVSGNTNAPTMMIAQRASEMILAGRRESNA